MTNSIRKEDIRNKKTETILNDAMFTLLERYNFKKITVSDLCEEAQISRATFYAHFNDKYDLIRFILAVIRKSVVKDVYQYDELEREVNQFIDLNKKVITNILKDANSETLMLVHEFMSSVVDLSIKRKTRNQSSSQHIILFNFLNGGLVNHLTWIVENNFPPEIRMINLYLYKMLEAMTIWDAEQEQKEIEGKWIQ